MEAAIKDLNPRHRLTTDKLPLELTRELCARLKNLCLQTDLGKLDCLGEIAGIGDYDKAFARATVVALAFGNCHVLDLDALIESKLAVGREKDLGAARFLRAIKDKPGAQRGQ